MPQVFIIFDLSHLSQTLSGEARRALVQLLPLLAHFRVFGFPDTDRKSSTSPVCSGNASNIRIT